jgi:tellurite resistance protein TehA-like permease
VGRGDHWITGGALAISTLAAGRITLAAHSLNQLTPIHSALKALSLALWILTMAWLPVLLIAEAARPRFAYDVRRWSTVFPVGMYAACSFVVAAAISARAIRDFAEVWVWFGLAVWLLVFIAMIRRGSTVIRGQAFPQPRSGRRTHSASFDEKHS